MKWFICVLVLSCAGNNCRTQRALITSECELKYQQCQTKDCVDKTEKDCDKRLVKSCQ